MAHLTPETATYSWTSGNELLLYRDGSDDERGGTGAFAHMRMAIEQAEHFLFIADWSFHPYFRLTRTAKPIDHPKRTSETTDANFLAETIGANLVTKALANKRLIIAIHTWDHTNIAASDDANDFGEETFEYLANILQSSRERERHFLTKGRPRNLLWRASSRSGKAGYSHHQKFIVCDAPAPATSKDQRRRLLAFLGGLDITKGRYDWSQHGIFPGDSGSETLTNGTRMFAPWRLPIYAHTQQIRDLYEDYDDWYVAEFPTAHRLLRQPWHDIHARVIGPAAWDVLREFVGRWNVDPSYVPDAMGDDSREHIRQVQGAFKQLFDQTRFVQQSEPHGGEWDTRIVRSMVKSHWGSKGSITTKGVLGTRREFSWTITQRATLAGPVRGIGQVNREECESSIHAAYLDAISSAKRFVYIESQYLIGSGDRWVSQQANSARNDVPEALVNTICDRSRSGEPFHVYIVLPMFPEGDPSSLGTRPIRSLQWQTIGWMIQTLMARSIEWRKFLSFYFLANWRSVAAAAHKPDRLGQVCESMRYMIYVHSKFAIVDDEQLILGSANLNERSLAGDRDLEICAYLRAPSSDSSKRCREFVRNFRLSLWEEHFGSGLATVGVSPELCWAKVQDIGQTNYFKMRRREVMASGHACLWPIKMYSGLLYFHSENAIESDNHIPDGLFGSQLPSDREEWQWFPPFPKWLGSRVQLFE